MKPQPLAPVPWPGRFLVLMSSVPNQLNRGWPLAWSRRFAVFAFLVVWTFGATSDFGQTTGASSGGEAMALAGVDSVGLAVPVADGAATFFESLPGERTGINLRYSFPTNAPFELMQDQGCANGVCIGDYDSDGWPDVYLTHYNRGNRLYRNLGGWRFEDVTTRAGVGGAGRWCSGTTFVDIDNDGDLDLYVCVFNGPNLLYLNQGDGTFLEAAHRFGLDFSGASVMAAFGDYDRDGRIDAYLVTHRLNVGTDHRLPMNSAAAFKRAIIHITGPGQISVDPAYGELFGTISKGSGRTELIIAGQRDYLYHNDGSNRFTVVNEKAGIQGHDIGLAAAWWDYDDDGFPDLYVSNDYKGPDRLYRNGRDGTFTEVAGTALPHMPWSSMGVDMADVDNDGRIDLMATEMAGSTHFRRMMINGDLTKERWFLSIDPRQYQRNALYLSTGTDRVLEVACLAGLDRTDWTWSPKFADLDNDGRVDLFIANGMARDFVNADASMTMRDRGSRNWLNMPVLREENFAFRNMGELRFEDVSRSWGLNKLTASFGAAFGDLDRDGDLDLIVSHFDEPVSVYRNAGSGGHRVLVRLKGTRSNSWGIGAKVTITTALGSQTRTLSLASGMMSANEPLLHFGLGTESMINQLQINWPSGRRQTVSGLAADRFYTITESAEAIPMTKAAAPRPRFVQVDQAAKLRQPERDFDDFAREPSLPWKLSQLGPGLALADVDGDGDLDLYLGGPAGRSGMLCLNDGQGHFQPMSTAAFNDDRAAEDMGALFFDADGDGDSDLYVASGGVECGPGDVLLRDRLYLNDGHGHFVRAPVDALPDLRDSGSVVTAADFDRDGDLDLLVGSRCIPGRYPEIPISRLLRNDGGRFTDVTESNAPALRKIGLVTSAVWSDANDDGWPDLLITREWNSVAVLLNERGHLVERTVESGLAHRTGWWNGIAAGDFDGDGDIDYVITNLGLNTPYRASEAAPCVAYLVPGTEPMRLVEACFEHDKLVPVRRREWFLEMWPALIERFPTYRSFASASLVEILTEETLGKSRRLTATTLESGLLVNDGRAHFEFRPLPRLAQMAPAFGVVATDLDGDGRMDLYLAQNFFSPQPETGRMDGGLGQLLQGRGEGQFSLVEPAFSGLVVAGDGKSAVAGDINGDGRPDLIVAVNNGDLCVFTNATDRTGRILSVQLRGKRGNATGIGARVAINLSDGSRQTAEMQAGGGYLSQSSPCLYFGLGITNLVTQLSVRWSDGTQTKRDLPVSGVSVFVNQSE